MRSGMILRTILCCGAFVAASAATPLRAQLRVISQKQLDSLANPAKAAGSEAMHFDRTTIDAGRLSEDDAPSAYTFRWTNRGGKPLVITRVVTTCGCAVATYDKQPVKTGESAQVTITYHPKGHPGRFDRKIFVYTQLSDKYSSAILNLTGSVSANAQTAAGFPVSMGALQLNRQSVTFDGNGGVQQASVLCRNTGSKTLNIGYNAYLLPKGFSATSEPAQLKPGAEGTLTIRFDPEAAAMLPRQVSLVLEGLGVPPSQSTIRILIDKTE